MVSGINGIKGRGGTCRFANAVKILFLSFVALNCTKALANDLQPSSDLVESPLSISLNPYVAMSADGQSIIGISQYGINNITNVIQQAAPSNSVNVLQNGNSNLSNIVQLGLNNTVNLVQNNDNNNFAIFQWGNDNVANVNQLGEQEFFVYQIGNGMAVTITQYME